MSDGAGLPLVDPDSAEGIARVLIDAAAERQHVRVRGAGTKWDWRAPERVDLILATTRLTRLLTHEQGDLTAEVEAGMSLRALNAHLRAHGQWLPLDTAFDDATVGGIVATNDAGALRHRFGTPRDQLIGIRLVTPDGQLVKSGGRVVKNVAGYDLGKLVTGSFGSLAVITSATFKLAPRPAAFGTLVLTFVNRTDAAGAAAALAASQLEPIALDIASAGAGDGRPVDLLVRFGSTLPSVETQLRAARSLASAFRPDQMRVVHARDDEEIWRGHGPRPWRGRGSVLRVTWLPGSMAAMLDEIDTVGMAGVDVELTGRAGIGSGVLRIDGELDRQVDAVTRIRQRRDVFTRVTVLRQAPGLASRVADMEPSPRIAALQAAIKGAFDPHGVLAAGRGL